MMVIKHSLMGWSSSTRSWEVRFCFALTQIRKRAAALQLEGGFAGAKAAPLHLWKSRGISVADQRGL